MITEDYVPTGRLRWAKSGSLQQEWSRRVIEYRTYGGQDRRCESWETEWRDVPIEGAVSASTNQEKA
jgi:hypothetical protein